MKNLLKNSRERKNLKTREVSRLLGIDQALISKFESGTRRPTEDQIIKLATLLEIDFESLMTLWLKEKILAEIGTYKFALQALKMAEDEMRLQTNDSPIKTSSKLQQILDEIDQLKFRLNKLTHGEYSKKAEILELEYIFESTQIDNNTLTFSEMELVVNMGMTISGKSMKEHLEIINHREAVLYIKSKKEKNSYFSEQELRSLHSLLYRGISNINTGQYRKISSVDSEKQLQSDSVEKQLESFFVWYEMYKNELHPVLLATEVYLKLILIQPFEDGSDKIASLIMNLILLQNGYAMVNVKKNPLLNFKNFDLNKQIQDVESQENRKIFIIQLEKESLSRFLN